MRAGSFERKIARLTQEAIDQSLGEIGAEFERRYTTPAEQIIHELRAYADQLRTWTVADEAFNARPLKQLLEDAAQTIAIRARQRNED